MSAELLVRACGAALLAGLAVWLIVWPLYDGDAAYAGLVLLVVVGPLVAWLYSLPRMSTSNYLLNGVFVALTIAVLSGVEVAERDEDMSDSAAFITGLVAGGAIVMVGLTPGLFGLLVLRRRLNR